MLLALPDRGSPWEPSRDCLPDEIAEERVADCVRVGGSVAEFNVKKYAQRVEMGGIPLKSPDATRSPQLSLWGAVSWVWLRVES